MFFIELTRNRLSMKKSFRSALGRDSKVVEWFLPITVMILYLPITSFVVKTIL